MIIKVAVILLLFSIFARGQETILFPNGGEILTAGSEVTIRWSANSTDTVRLEYSPDGGMLWKLISPIATGGEYNWVVPNDSSDKCFVRAIITSFGNEPGWVTQSSDDASNGYNASLACDRHDNVHLFTSLEGNINVSGRSFSKIQRKNGFIARYRSDGELTRIVHLGSDSGMIVAYGDIFVDKNDQTYIASQYLGRLNFNGIDLHNYVVPDSSNFTDGDIFIAKLDTSGAVVWAKGIGDNDIDVGYSVAADTADNVYVTGFFTDTADFEGTHLRCKNRYDIFLAKYRADGVFEWAISEGGLQFDSGSEIIVDQQGHIYIVGYYEGIYLAKFKADGTFIWKKTIGKDNSAGQGIALGHGGEIFVVGHYYDTVDFGDTVLVATGIYDAFIAKLDSNGSISWVRNISGTGSDYLRSVSITQSGDLFVAGSVRDTVTLNDTTIFVKHQDIFVGEYTTDGALKWFCTAGGAGDDYAEDLEIDTKGRLYVTGIFQGDAQFGDISIPSRGEKSVFLWKLGPFVSDASDSSFTIVRQSSSVSNIPTKIKEATIRIVGSPNSEIIEYEVDPGQAGQLNIALVDMLGRTVATVCDGEMRPGKHTLKLSTTGIAAGSYYLILMTSTVRRSVRVDIVR